MGERPKARLLVHASTLSEKPKTPDIAAIGPEPSSYSCAIGGDGPVVVSDVDHSGADGETGCGVPGGESPTLRTGCRVEGNQETVGTATDDTLRGHREIDE